MTKEKPLQLKVDLIGDHKLWFKNIQKKYSFPSYAEVIRFAIFTTKEVIDREEMYKTIEIDPIQFKLISKLLSSDYVKQTYNIYNSRDFITRAMAEFIDKIRNSQQSLLSWDVKNSLSGDEQSIALAFAKCYNRSKNKEVTVKDIANEIQWRDLSKIQKIMDKFVDQFFAKKVQKDENTIYYLLNFA